MTKYTMDSIFPQIKNILTTWNKLNQRLRIKALVKADKELNQIHFELDEQYCKLANLASLGSDEAWRVLGSANGMAFDDKDIIARFAELCQKSIKPDLYSVLVDEIIPALKKND